MNISRRELYSGSMVIFIGLFYLVAVASGLFNTRSLTALGWQDIKQGLLAVFFIISGILFLRKKAAGWIFTAGILLNFVLVIGVIIISLASSGPFVSYAALQLMLLPLFLLAFIFLFRKETRKKYRVNNKSYLLTLGVYLLVITVYFLL
jgi:hypothetical protein